MMIMMMVCVGSVVCHYVVEEHDNGDDDSGACKSVRVVNRDGDGDGSYRSQYWYCTKHEEDKYDYQPLFAKTWYRVGTSPAQR